MAESQGASASPLPGDSGAETGNEEPLTANILRSALSEMTEIMRQQQQSIQLMLQHFSTSTISRSQTVANGIYPFNAEEGSRASVARSPSVEGRSARQTESNIPGNSVSWLTTQIPEFGGTEDENINTWVKRVDQVARVHGTPDGVTLLAASSKLTKFAKTWYEVQTGPTIESWVGLRDWMITIFVRKILFYKAVQKTESRKWMPSKESFDHYAIAKLALIHQLDLPVKDTIHLLISGISNNAVRASALLLADSTLEHFMEKMRNVTEGLSNTVEKNRLRSPTMINLRALFVEIVARKGICIRIVKMILFVFIANKKVTGSSIVRRSRRKTGSRIRQNAQHQ